MKLSVTFGRPRLKVDFNPSKLNINLGLPIIRGHDDTPIYDGDYIVIPLAWEEQVLPTEMKLLTQNLTVLEIPYYETSNPSGGYTVNIG